MLHTDLDYTTTRLLYKYFRTRETECKRRNVSPQRPVQLPHMWWPEEVKDLPTLWGNYHTRVGKRSTDSLYESTMSEVSELLIDECPAPSWSGFASTHGRFIDPISSNSSSQNIDIQELHLDNSGNPYRAVLWQESRLSLLIVLDPNNAEDDIVELARAIHAMDLPRLCTEIDTSYRACSASKEYVLVLNQSALLTT